MNGKQLSAIAAEEGVTIATAAGAWHNLNTYYGYDQVNFPTDELGFGGGIRPDFEDKLRAEMRRVPQVTMPDYSEAEEHER